MVLVSPLALQFERDPAAAILSILEYGLDRYQAGKTERWPTSVSDQVRVLVGTPRRLAGAFRVQGLGTGLAALRIGDARGIAIPRAQRSQVCAALEDFYADRARAEDDLTFTDGLSSLAWERNQVLLARIRPDCCRLSDY